MLLSVIIPSRDRPEYLREAVASVIRQSVHDWELLIVNDGTAPIEAFSDHRIRILSSNARGAVPARNLGVAQAQGDVLAWLDDDDVWIDEHHLHHATQALQSHDGLFFADGIMRFPGEVQARHFARDADRDSLARDNTILISTVCYRRNVHDQLGSFDEALSYYWDWDWYLRVARSGHEIIRHPEPAVDIRIHPHNMSGDSNRLERQKNLGLLVQKHRLGKITLKNHTDFVS